MKNILLLASIAVLLTSACSKDRVRIKGEGPILTEEREVSIFDEVRLSISATVIWHKDSNHRVIVEAQKNIAEFLLTEQNGDRITVKYKNFTTVKNHEPITIHLYSPSAEAIVVDGSGEVRVNEDVSTKRINIKVSGSGDVKLNSQITEMLEVKISGSGSIEILSTEICKEADFKISGSGKLIALNLPTKDIKIDISGSGKSDVNALNELDVCISGSGRVRYKGAPSIKKQITGSGSVEKY